MFILRTYITRNRINEALSHMKGVMNPILKETLSQRENIFHHWLHLFHFEIQHFVNSVSFYLNNKLLEAEMRLLEVCSKRHQLKSVRDIYAGHDRYLDFLISVMFQTKDLFNEEIRSCFEFFSLFSVEFKDLVLSFERLSEVGFSLLRDQEKQFKLIKDEMVGALSRVGSRHSAELCSALRTEYD